jgi:hypothetical protein
MTDVTHPLYDLPTPLIVGAVLLTMIVAGLLARRAGAGHVEAWPKTHDALLNVTGAMLLLLGLLLAFSFNLSVGRFQARQAALLAEANAITTVDLLADTLLPGPRAILLSELRAFTGQRIAFLAVGHDPERERAAAAASSRAAARIWHVVVRAENYHEPVGQNLSLLARAMTDLIAVARAREAARSTLVPQPILIMLFVLATLATTMVAFNVRASGQRSRILPVTFMLLICMVIYVVIDLDRPRRGLMRLDTGPLHAVLEPEARPRP